MHAKIDASSASVLFFQHFSSFVEQWMSRIYKAKMWHNSLILSCVFCVAIGVSSLSGNAQNESVDAVTITVDPSIVVNKISPEFIGFGYESSAVAQTNYFSGHNDTLIQLYRNLSNHGLIRIGGCASDNTQYIPDGTAVARSFRELTVLNYKSLTDFGAFTKASGWKVMWGLNLGKGTKQDAVSEAVAVDETLGPQLESFEIGNEVEGLPRFKRSYDDYHAAYVDYKAGIRAVLPNSPFSGPDSVGHWDWITKFVSTESKDLQLLTQHYYCADAHDPKASISKMLAQDDRWEKRLKDLQQLSEANGIHYRINEVNSFSSGGKPGVSDTFGSALWCLDYMFLLAEYGCEGVNMQTDFNHLAFISHYSPIVHDENGTCSARPEYYGMLAFALTGKGNLVKSSLNKGDINLTVYATKSDDQYLWVIVVNKDLSKGADVQLTLPEGYMTAEAYRLKAPTVESTDQVSLADAEVTPDGKWTPGAFEPEAVRDDVLHMPVPHASAALLRLSP